MSSSDSASDHSAAAEKETLKEALSELLVEMPVFKVLMGEAEAGTAASAGPSRRREASRGSEAG